MKTPHDRIPYDYVKRSLDLVAALLGLLITAPVQGIVAVLVRAKLGRPVLFRQQRPGRDGTPFELIKFRTMRLHREDDSPASDAQRLTRFGRVLRSTSLDELPTLINVLRGDMSMVGPRPLLLAYLDRYTPTQARRHEVRPGVTGLAQVNGRNDLDWERKFELDVEYVDRRSFGLDLRILMSTALVVLRRDGVARTGHATTTEYLGPDSEGG